MDTHQFAELAQAITEVGGAIILGLWALVSHNLKVSDRAKDLVTAALPNAVHWAESELGPLTEETLTSIAKKHAFLEHGLKYMATHVPNAMKKLGLDNIETEEKLMVALSKHLSSFGQAGFSELLPIAVHGIEQAIAQPPAPPPAVLAP